MRKKVLFFLLFPLLAEVVVSCCNCPDPDIKHYTNRTASVHNLDNTGSGPVVSSSGTIAKEAYGIRVDLKRELTAHTSRGVFLSQAYAYDCFCEQSPQFLPKDSITALQVFTLRDFDNIHPAGSDVSTYFKAYHPYYFLTIPDLVEKWDTVLYDESRLETKVDLMLMTPPGPNTRHQFRVRITLSDGRTLEEDTPPIELT